MKSNRRKFIQNLGVGAAGLTIGSSAISLASCSSAGAKASEEDGQILFIGDNIALADTQYGKVKGYQLRGINYFLGIPYGADTSGANRFMPPQKPKPWTEVLPAVWWLLNLITCKPPNSGPIAIPTTKRAFMLK